VAASVAESADPFALKEAPAEVELGNYYKVQEDATAQETNDYLLH